MPATEYQVPTPLFPAVITPSRRSGFRPLPPCQPVVRFRFGLYGVVGGGVRGGGEFDDVAVGVAEIDRVDESVVGDAAGFDAGRLAPLEHVRERRRVDLEGERSLFLF